MCPDKGLPTLVILEGTALLTLLTFSYIAPSNEEIYNMFFFMGHKYFIFKKKNNFIPEYYLNSPRRGNRSRS